MIKPYNQLNNEEKFKRSVYVGIFSIILVILLFSSSTFPMCFNLLATAVLVIVGIYQLRRDYRNLNRE